MKMDYNNNYNDYNTQRPRKKVSKETFRKRQLTAVFVIAFILLLIIVLFAKACSKDSVKKTGDTKVKNKTAVTTTTTVDSAAVTTAPPVTTEAVTEPTTPDPNDTNSFQLDKYTVYVDIGGTDMPFVQGYPEGSSEADELWSSDNTAIATVDAYGHITGVSPGECYVILRSAKDQTKEAYVKVVVADSSNAAATTDANGENATSADATESATTLSSNTQEPQLTAEAPAPSKIDDPSLHYETFQGEPVLIVNKSYSMNPANEPGGLEATTAAQFDKLAQAAAADGLTLWVASGFRSYSYQDQIYNNYVNMSGQATADTFSARPGHSEHETGLAIDVNDPSDSFNNTAEAAWLAKHCWDYGFILRYPQGKQDITGYKYESWHIRYVGTKLSKELQKSGQTMEEYFGLTSQYQ